MDAEKKTTLEEDPVIVFGRWEQSTDAGSRSGGGPAGYDEGSWPS